MFILYLSAASLGLIHTVLGPDHYIPFIMMGRAGKWSLRKTCRVTILCGIGHVAGLTLLLCGVGITFWDFNRFSSLLIISNQSFIPSPEVADNGMVRM
jgi:hypothetical protein